MKYISLTGITFLMALCMSIPVQGGPFHHDEISDRWSYGYDYCPELGPLTIGAITENDRANIEGLKNIYGGVYWCKNYYSNRTLMAKAVRLYHAAQTQSESDKALLNEIFSAAMWIYHDFHLVKDLMEHGVNPNELVGDLPVRPLFLAKTVAMAELLVAHKASFSGEDRIYQDSMLHNACRDHSADVLDYFLKHSGLDVNNRRGSDGYIPLHVLIRSVSMKGDPVKDAPIKLSLLLGAVAKVMLRNNKNQTALDMARAGITACAVYGRGNIPQLQDFATTLAAAMEKEESVMKAAEESARSAEVAQRRAEALNVRPSCAICLEEFTSADNCTSLQCAHRFHTTCINEWLAVTSECPLCRLPIRSAHIGSYFARITGCTVS